MSEQNQAPEVTSVLETRIQVACDIATGRIPADPADAGKKVIGAKKDLNCKGRGPQWYRMVYRNAWQYVSSDRLPSGNFLAADRRATVYGIVYPGEIVVSHDRGKPVDCAWLVCPPDAYGKVMVDIGCPAKRRDGQLYFTLPDGSVVVLPDPCKN